MEAPIDLAIDYEAEYSRGAATSRDNDALGSGRYFLRGKVDLMTDCSEPRHLARRQEERAGAGLYL
jgi:hypothetical protein